MSQLKIRWNVNSIKLAYKLKQKVLSVTFNLKYITYLPNNFF